MSWQTQTPIFGLMASLLEARIRSRRIALFKKVRAVEGHARSMGVPTDAFRELRAAFPRAKVPLNLSHRDHFPIVPASTKTVIHVVQLPGSQF